MQNEILITTVSQSEVLINAVGAFIGAISFYFIALSFFLTWQRTHFRMLLALWIIFLVLAVNKTASSFTNFAFLINNKELEIIPFFEYRQWLLTASAIFLFWALWRKNHKVEKTMIMHDQVKETISDIKNK